MHNYKELSVWNKSVSLATDIYASTKTFPGIEKFGITSQIRRSTVSISSNIAEGAGRFGKKEFRHFLNIAYGSSFELETQLIISKNLDYLSELQFNQLTEDLITIQKMLYKLIKSLN
ncbi:four helix bundle protein [Rhodohalobacter sp. SW132]|uniref:four helix bundle protein n=1 Tax=Rhodohalobacter sp. SW132 TaxID=2293433 RepID=UPI000E2399DC|nr:four helix bundle protein [Rhodohalobacter sp. SW132]REL38152.1 four helix bundle protein [Rhodohalobacter sp. SW132]